LRVIIAGDFLAFESEVFTMQTRSLGALGLFLVAATVTACGGGGGGGYGGSPPPHATTAPPSQTQQVIRAALPTSPIGQFNDPLYGLIAGYTQTKTSQVLGFLPGSQVMIANAQSASSNIPHTLGDTGGQGQFPSGQPSELSMQSNTPNGGSFTSGFQTGTISAGTMVGPFTLTTGVYFIGCAYHYSELGMRDVLVVASNAKPGATATSPPGESPPPSGNGY
jgi:hypothetical protein